MTEQNSVVTPADAVKGTAGTPPAPQSGERPAWLPEKFQKPEDMAAAYAELEKKQGTQGQPQTPPADPNATPPAADKKDPATPNDKAEKPASEGQKPAMDFSPFEKEITETGALSDDAYTKLEEMGFPRAMAESYVKGLLLQADQQATQFYEIAGGKDEYGKFIAWAESHAPKDLETVLGTTYPNVEAAKLALAGLHSRYQADAEPSLTQGGNGGGAAGYASQAQMLVDMASPQYKNDPAFRAQVDQKILNSPWFRGR